MSRWTLFGGERDARQEDHGSPGAQVQGPLQDAEPDGGSRQGGHQRAQRALSIVEDLTARLRERLDAGELEAALIALPFEAPHLRVASLYDEPFDVVLPRGHALAAAGAIAPERLRAETVLLLHGGHCFSNQVIGACPGVEERATLLEGNSLETVRNLVAAGQGVSVLPRGVAYCPATTAQLEIRPFSAPAPSRRIALVWRESFPRPQAVHAVAELIRASGLCGIEPLAAADWRTQSG